MFRIIIKRSLFLSAVLAGLLSNLLSAQVLTHSAVIGGVKQRFKNAQNYPGDAEKQWKESIELLEKDIAANAGEKSKLEESYFFLGAVHYRKNDFEKAYDAFQKSLSFSKKHWDEGEKISGGIPLYSTKESLNDIKLKVFNKASKSYNDALAITSPDSAKLDSMRKLLYTAIDRFQLVLRWDSTATVNGKNVALATYGTIANAYIVLSNNENEEGNRKVLREKILANLIKMSKLDPNSMPIILNIYNLYNQDKNYDECIRWIDRAMKIETKDSSAMATKNQLIAQKALILDLTGKPEEALKTYIEAIKVDPNSSDLHFNLAVLYMKRKDNLKALAEFKIVKKLKPNDVESNYQIANEGFKAYQDKRREATEKYASNPKKFVEFLKPDIESCSKDLKESVDALVQELPSLSDNRKAETFAAVGAAYNYMAQLAGDLVYDLENKDKVIKQKPFFEKAVEHLKKAVELNPKDKGSWYQLGIANMNLQLKKEAEAAFDKAK
jgi:tetratricopeptide (TPR) repeat protein